MTLAIRNAAGALNPIANIRVRTAGGLEEIVAAFARDSGKALRQFFGQFTVTVSGSPTARINSSETTAVTTRAAHVNVEGAVGNVTYAWTQTSGDAGWSINNPTESATTFTVGLGPGESSGAAFTCHVTDSGGHSADVSVNASASNVYFSGGTVA